MLKYYYLNIDMPKMRFGVPNQLKHEATTENRPQKNFEVKYAHTFFIERQFFEDILDERTYELIHF